MSQYIVRLSKSRFLNITAKLIQRQVSEGMLYVLIVGSLSALIGSYQLTGISIKTKKASKFIAGVITFLDQKSISEDIEAGFTDQCPTRKPSANQPQTSSDFVVWGSLFMR